MKKHFLLKLLTLFLCMTMLCACANAPANNNPPSNAPSEENKDDANKDAAEDSNDDASNEDSGAADSDGSTPDQEDTSFIVELSPCESAIYEKAEESFAPLVEKLRNDGLLAANEKCVYLDSNVIYFDITKDDGHYDLSLFTVDASQGLYSFDLSINLWYLEGFSEVLINGIDPAPYNKEAIMIMLGMYFDNPQIIFDTIDQTYFSSFALSSEEWTPVGDYQMMDGGVTEDDAYAYSIKVTP